MMLCACSMTDLQVVVVEVWQHAQVDLGIMEDSSHLSCTDSCQPAVWWEQMVCASAWESSGAADPLAHKGILYIPLLHTVLLLIFWCFLAMFLVCGEICWWRGGHSCAC